MRVLYHFKNSPFSRRTRLALAFKGLNAELREARDNPAFREEAARLSPLRTIPVLVEPDGRALGDSSAIAHYFDRAYPTAVPLWPTDKDDAFAAFDIASLVDTGLNILIDLGLRYFGTKDSNGWPAARNEMVGRAQQALNGVAARVEMMKGDTVCSRGWSAADMWIYTAITWLEGLPGRAPTFPIAAQIVSLEYEIPKVLSAWAAAHRNRDDVQALDKI